MNCGDSPKFSPRQSFVLYGSLQNGYSQYHKYLHIGAEGGVGLQVYKNFREADTQPNKCTLYYILLLTTYVVYAMISDCYRVQLLHFRNEI